MTSTIRLDCTGTIDHATLTLSVTPSDGVEEGEDALIRATSTLLGLGVLELAPDGRSYEARGDDAAFLWSHALYTLPEEWELYVPADLSRTSLRDAALSPRLRTSVGAIGGPLLCTRLVATVDGEELPADVVRTAAAEGRSLLPHGSDVIRVESGALARISASEAKRLEHIPVEVDTVSLPDLPSLDPVLGAFAAEETADAAAVRAALAPLYRPEAPTVPEGLTATLFSYQEVGVAWLRMLYASGMGGILADEMGTGKSIQTITMLLGAKQSYGRIRALVVCPKSLVPNWMREFSKFAPSIRTHAWAGPDRMRHESKMRSAEVVVTSYPLVLGDAALFATMEFDAVVIDEAQAIKNHEGQTAKAVKNLRRKRGFALTGTPVENRIGDLHSIMSFAMPGLLSSRGTFDAMYGRDIMAGDRDASKRLKTLVQPFILRRLKSDVQKDLPERRDIDLLVTMTENQEYRYNLYRKSVRTALNEMSQSRALKRDQAATALKAITNLRQIACDLRLLKWSKPNGERQENYWAPEDSGKLEALEELLGELMEGDHKVLIFSQWTNMLNFVGELLVKLDLKHERLDGETKRREEVVDRFQTDPSIKVFLLSITAGGVGLNITAADTVIIMDPWWNPALEEQALARAHRIGQQRAVTVYRIISAGTLEERMLEMKARKRAVAGSVLDGDDPTGGFSLAEIKGLFDD